MQTQTEREFYSKYHPIKNPIDNNASMDGYMVETYGPELEYIKSLPNERVFTIIDNNEGWYGLVAGYHWINRMGFIVIEEQWESSEEEYTIYDNTEIREQWDALPAEAIQEITDIKVTGDDEDGLEEVRDEWFYLWEDMDEDERDEIVARYKTTE